MDSGNLASQGEKEEVAKLPLEYDLAARRRLKVILDLAITIGTREGLIGNHGENPAIDKGEAKEAEQHDN